MSVNRNSYGKQYRSRLPRRSNARRMPGDLEDHGVWYRCRICGFPCNVNRNMTAPGDTQDYVDGGNVFTAFVTEGITYYEPIAIAGCPMCGSLAWK